MFITICWFIWNQRNKIRVKDIVAPLEKTSDLAQQYLMEFQQLRSKPVTKKLPKKVIWKPPDAGLLKTNFDGAAFEDLGATGIGVVDRNSSDEVLAGPILDHSSALIYSCLGNYHSSKGNPFSS